jgi:hypothetical protein
MKSSKIFNNVSDKLKAEIPRLKPGETVVFRMLNGVPNPEPDANERSKDPILYGKVQVQTNFRIYDPYVKDSSGKEVGGYVDCGCVDDWDGDKPRTFRFFVPGQGLYSRFQGKFSFTGGVARDEELFEILWLSPQRKGSPCADGAVEPLFEMVDLKSDTKASLTKFDILRKALDIIKDIKPEKAREVMAALNQPSYQDDEVLMAKIKDLASSKPDDFIKTFESKETPIYSVVKEAIANGTLTHDISTGEVKLGGVRLMELKTDDSGTFVTEFAKWIGTSENGQDVLNNIKSRVGKKAVK